MTPHGPNRNIVASHNNLCWHSIVLVLVRSNVGYFLEFLVFIFVLVIVYVITKLEPVVVFEVLKWSNFGSEAGGL